MAMRAKKNNSVEFEAIKRRHHPRTGDEYSIVSIPLPDGGFIASVAQDQSFTATASSRSEAEQAVEAQFLSAKKNPATTSRTSAMYMFSHPEEFEPWPASEEQGAGVEVFFPKGKGTPWRDVKRENGL